MFALLTASERKVIIFVLCLVLLGIGIDCIKKKTGKPTLFDSEALKDSMFDKVDINRAGTSQLMGIPGIGRKLSTAIIEYRRSHGCFASLHDVKKVKGIKERKFKKIKPYITISNEENSVGATRRIAPNL